MKFSIVITTYNRLTLLKRAIDSALAQTWPCEVVVVDDCSTDGTEAYVRSLGDRVVYHRNQANLGHSASVNAGVEVAQGEWVKPFDDDDYLAPNCIEEMVRAIAGRPQAVLCSCQAIQVDDKEVEISRTTPCGPGSAFYVPQEDVHYGMLLELLPFGTPIQVAFQRQAFLKTGGWDSSLDTNCDDIDSWIKIAQHGDAIFINKYLAYRTVWPGAYNYKFPLEKRLETNILLKEKIHPLVASKHRSSLPTVQETRNFLKLHWSLVGLKQGKVVAALKMSSPAIFSPAAWQFFAKVTYARRISRQTQSIRQEAIPDVVTVKA